MLSGQLTWKQSRLAHCRLLFFQAIFVFKDQNKGRWENIYIGSDVQICLVPVMSIFEKIEELQTAA